MRALRALAFLALPLALAGCQFGPAFVPLAVPLEKSLVYIYQAQAPLINTPYGFTVHADRQPVVFLRSGGYFPYLAEPKPTEFWARTEATSSITLDLEPGKVYYLKGEQTIGITTARPKLTLVDEELGLSEVRECWRLYSLVP